MTNEWKEFQAYISAPEYRAKAKRDLSYLGRFSFKTITDFEGLGRILTIIARGYLFHDKEGSVLKGDPYGRTEHAKKALCAWCSMPGKNTTMPHVNFSELSDSFSELVNAKGEGWFYRHIQNIVRFAKQNPEVISEKARETIDGIAKGFKTEWRKKVRQLQVPVFALNTKAAWALRFDDILADALELGALRTEEYLLPPDKEELLRNIDCAVPENVLADVVCYCEANKREEDTKWVVLPVANFDCYYGNTNFSRKWLSKIPEEVLTRQVSNGICRVRSNI